MDINSSCILVVLCRQSAPICIGRRQMNAHKYTLLREGVNTLSSSRTGVCCNRSLLYRDQITPRLSPACDIVMLQGYWSNLRQDFRIEIKVSAKLTTFQPGIRATAQQWPGLVFYLSISGCLTRKIFTVSLLIRYKIR